ncbi:hypothetical protein [Archaeoglobus veneficus]|uniref:Uncharacterized protein n=1 Tax=Archaeoglobus veneficus (strain DSM 11195 / SNP6) TaxID=693661 RepID=F2KPM5_ARCVS|nr:hypothetical protein [Archaeoglobus veneficus]AEA47553.1 hypothetical protein Arcve_1551 [Archaeoglobus veneficus SNP6]
MRKAWIGLISAMVLLACSGVLAAQNDAIGAQFRLEKGVAGYYIPLGSVVHHFADGTTVVHGPDGMLKLRLNNTKN